MSLENPLFSGKKILPKVKKAVVISATLMSGVEGAACAPPKTDNGQISTAVEYESPSQEKKGSNNPLPIGGERLSGDFDTEYRESLSRAMHDHLNAIGSTKRRSGEARRLNKELTRVVENVWSRRFAGNDNGQRAYFRAILENVEYRARVRRAIEKACYEFNVPRSLVFGIVGVEGGGRHQIESSTGALGIMQVTPAAAVEAGIFTREQLYDRDRKGNFTIVNNEKNEALKQFLRKDLELNMRAGVGYLKILAGRLNNDWGLAVGMYCTKPAEFRQFLVDGYNAKLKAEYDKRVVLARSRGHKKPLAPTYMTTSSVSRYGWSRWLSDNNISSMSLMVDRRAYYPTDDYPFQVLVMGPLVEKILTSQETQVSLPSLVDDTTRSRLAVKRNRR